MRADDAVLVRLANEGVPVAAMARAVARPSDEIWPVLHEARDRGEIVALPAYDWPPGTRRESRTPTMAFAGLPDLDRVAFDLVRLLKLRPSCARILAFLYIRGSATKAQLHATVSGDLAPATSPRLVDVQIHHLRKALKEQRPLVVIENVWGQGCAMPEAARADLRALLEAGSDARVVA